MAELAVCLLSIHLPVELLFAEQPLQRIDGSFALRKRIDASQPQAASFVDFARHLKWDDFGRVKHY